MDNINFSIDSGNELVTVLIAEMVATNKKFVCLEFHGPFDTHRHYLTKDEALLLARALILQANKLPVNPADVNIPATNITPTTNIY